MILSELIRRSIDIAIVGTNVDANWLQSQTLEAESVVDLALHDLSVEIAGDPELRARLEKQFSVTLTNGVGTIPAGLMVEYLREGSVKDSDIGANGFGNVLQRVKYLNDLLGSLTSVYGYYCVNDNQIRTKQISSGDLTGTVGPLIIDAPFVPTKANISTEVPDEITDDLTEILAVKLRGIISRMSQPK
jgi:hypothetical protein